MKKSAEFTAKNSFYRAVTERRDQVFLHLVSIKVSKVRANGTLAWVGTAVWDEQSGQWHRWEAKLPVTKQELVGALEMQS